MDLGSLFFILAVALAVAVFVSRPFLSRGFDQAWLPAARPGLAGTRKGQPDREKEASSLMAEYERLLAALQELEFDFNLGKISAEDYPGRRLDLLQSGAAVLKELDALAENTAAETAESRMEAEAARVSLAGTRLEPASAEMDDLEALVAERRRKRDEKSAGFCPKCGKAVQTSDIFCPKCGQKL